MPPYGAPSTEQVKPRDASTTGAQGAKTRTFLPSRGDNQHCCGPGRGLRPRSPLQSSRAQQVRTGNFGEDSRPQPLGNAKQPRVSPAGTPRTSPRGVGRPPERPPGGGAPRERTLRGGGTPQPGADGGPAQRRPPRPEGHLLVSELPAPWRPPEKQPTSQEPSPKRGSWEKQWFQEKAPGKGCRAGLT